MDEADALAIIAIGLRRKRRPVDLVKVADAIEYLQKIYPSTAEVAARAGVSSNMLNKFLAVRRVDKEVLALVKERRIDRVMHVFWIAKLRSSPMQRQLSRLILSEGLRTQEVRDIVAQVNRLKGTTVGGATRRVLSARPEKRHFRAVYMPLPPGAKTGRADERHMRAVLARKIPNHGLKWVEGAVIAFLDESDFKSVRYLARKHGVHTTSLATELLKGLRV